MTTNNEARPTTSRKSPLAADDVSAFCSGVASMLAAGIQTDEALALVGDSSAGTPLGDAALNAYAKVVTGETMSSALLAEGCFPEYVIDMLELGERSGRIEEVLESLAHYYDEEARVIAKVQTTVAYPTALLCVMSAVLTFTVTVILPVFIDVYDNMAGALTTGSSIAVSAAITVGWVALIVCLVATVLLLVGVVLSKSPAGQNVILRVMGKIPATSRAMYQLALSRWSAALSTCLATGANTDNAMADSMATVTHTELRKRLNVARDAMTDPDQALSLTQAVIQAGVLDQASARMLSIGSRVGSIDRLLANLSASYFEEGVSEIDRVIDATEPTLAAFLTLAVGATLVSAMLPLIGIMGSVG